MWNTGFDKNLAFEMKILVTLSQTSPGFYMSAKQVFWKHYIKRSVFYLFGKFSAILIKFEIVICKLFQFGRVYNLLFGKGINKSENCYRSFIIQALLLMIPTNGPFKNIVGKGENAGNQHFLLPTMFSMLLWTNYMYLETFYLSSANAFKLEKAQLLLSGKF